MTADERDPARVAIGAYLRARARRAGVTDEAAAAALDVGTSTVQRVYAGSHGTDWLVLLRLTRLVGGDMAALGRLLDEPSLELAAALAEMPTPAAPAQLAELAGRIAAAAELDAGLVPAVEGFIAGRLSRG
jgi:hypothetical protein